MHRWQRVVVTMAAVSLVLALAVTVTTAVTSTATPPARGHVVGSATDPANAKLVAAIRSGHSAEVIRTRGCVDGTCGPWSVVVTAHYSLVGNRIVRQVSSDDGQWHGQWPPGCPGYRTPIGGIWYPINGCDYGQHLFSGQFQHGSFCLYWPPWPFGSPGNCAWDNTIILNANAGWLGNQVHIQNAKAYGPGGCWGGQGCSIQATATYQPLNFGTLSQFDGLGHFWWGAGPQFHFLCQMQINQRGLWATRGTIKS